MKRRSLVLSVWVACFAAACGDVEGGNEPPNENEVITTVVLTFTPEAGGGDLAFTWADPENDGDPEIDAIVLPSGDYTMAVAFLNELAEPAEDITEEVAAESDQHQVFFTGSGVEGPATGPNEGAVITQAYVDTDENGLPVGLENHVATVSVGSGELTVSLRHMPPEDGAAVKVEGLAEKVASEGFGAIGGDNDVQVTFPIEVQ